MTGIRRVSMGFAGLVLLLLLAASWWLVSAPGPQERPGWSLGPELPQPFGELASVSLPREDGTEVLVVLSGISGFGRVVDEVFLLDPETGTWEAGPALPAPRHHAAAAVLDGAVVLSGGAAGLGAHPWEPRREVWSWRPGGDWEQLPGLPEGRWGHRMVEHGGRLYVVGGHGGAETLIYRPDHQGWAVAAPIPEARDHLSVVVVGDRIWAIGGRSPESVARVDIFEPGMETWERGPDLPQPTSGAAEGVVGDRIHIFGGEEPAFLGGGIIRRHWMLDTRVQPWQWLAAPPPPLAVHGSDGAVWQGRMVIAGGASRHGARSVTAWTDALQIMDANLQQ